MIKKLLLITMVMVGWQLNAYATDLLEVYQQAEHSDPIFQQAVGTRLAVEEGVPISIANLLPNIVATGNPSITRTNFGGTNIQHVVPNVPGIIFPVNNTAKSYMLALTATQTVFNFAQFSQVAAARATAKAADATFNAAVQSLMTRVAAAYFNVLRDKDNLAYNLASKTAYQHQLDQVKQQYKVGLKTVTELYTAQASYDSSVASYIAAQTMLDNDKENLHAITNQYYKHLAPLSNQFPLISPDPADIDVWVHKAMAQNWNIKAAQFSVESAKQAVHEQEAGHMPTVNIQGSVNRMYANNINDYTSFSLRNGPATQSDKEVMVNINLPLFAGGGVVAATHQATANYEVAEQQMEQVIRDTINITRQSYLSIIAGISQIQADQQAIKSSISSLHGMQASYRVGTETLVDVLNQQQRVFQAQTQYAADRYAFVNNILALKQAAGTLSFDDLRAINAWLVVES